MNNFVFVAVLIATLSASVSASIFLTCPAESWSCRGEAFLYIRQYGVGSCEGSSTAYCSAFAKGFKCVKAKEQHIDGECRNVYVKEDAKCYVQAAAHAVADAYSATKCTGERAFACATAESDAYAFACSFAVSIIELSISLHSFTAECEADLAVAVKAMAEAHASAAAAACAGPDDSPSFDADYAFGYAVQDAVAQAWASCVVYCGYYGVFTAVSGETIGRVHDKYVNYGGGGSAGTGSGY